jgi:rubrerythrin
MPISFSGSELLTIAIGIERRGIAFYDIMTRSTKNTIAREVFKYLGDMEQEHIHTFQDMLAEADKYQFLETPAGEYTTYLQALVDSAVFTNDLVTSEMATKVSSDIEAMELAIGAEKDSILFYYEMKDLMPQRAQPTVNKIIAEEKSHLRQLSELKKKLAAI